MSLLHSQNKIGNYRWTICALVFFATTINYLDRNVIGQLKDTLLPILIMQADNPVLLAWNASIGQISWLHWNADLKSTGELEYGRIVFAFQAAYALGLLCFGRVIDKIGSKHGYGLSLIGWSAAAIGHALSTGPFSFGAWRAALGSTEAGNFPAAQKTVTEWFPKKERALATGIYNSGTNVGAILAPLCVPWLASHYILGWSWQWAFVITGVLGLLWLVFWYGIYKTPSAKLADGTLSQSEYDYIHSDADEKAENSGESAGEKVSWVRLLGYRQTWAFFFGKFCTDGIWYFYLFWLPGFLSDENKRKITEAFPNGLPEGITLKAAAAELQSFSSLFGTSELLDKINVPGVIFWPLAVAVVYTISTFGSVFGGYLPKRFIDSGMDVNKARKTAMFIYALLPLTLLGAMKLGAVNTWLAVLIIGIAAAAHQAWSANIFTTVSDMFPKKAVGSVTGIGGMAGAIAGMLMAEFVGRLLEHYKQLESVATGYSILFVVCALAYITAWVLMHLLVPKFKKITDL
ncbi:MAG: MFS transporter [Puniceicoccales bacterium]|jgi:ACS family hexuronate transporter-like MFS transporter|nr:MFS transporter [Puniceicoccales bacterium]